MRPADGAGFYQGTDFWNWDVEQMWAAVDRHEPTDEHWYLQSSWRATHELILTHKYRVEEYREKLIQAWPPDRNAAAAAYVARLDRLLASLGETYEAAGSNDGAFSGAIWAIADRRRELKKVYDQYKANQAKLSDYARAEAEFGGTGAWNAMQPEVAKAQQEHVRLQSQASTIMVGLSTEPREATGSFKAPKPYNPTWRINKASDETEGADNLPP